MIINFIIISQLMYFSLLFYILLLKQKNYNELNTYMPAFSFTHLFNVSEDSCLFYFYCILSNNIKQIT